MTTAPESTATPAPKSLVSRFVGVIVAPQETFRSIVAHPRAFGMLALITIFMVVVTFAFLSTQVGREALLDQQISQMEAFGVDVSDQQIDQMEARVGLSAYIGAGSQLVAIPVIYLIMAGLLFAIFSAAMGGTASFKQVFTVVTHAGAVSVVQQAFVMPLNYVRGSLQSATNLGALLPMLPEGGFLSHLLSTIDVFIIWWVFVLAIGLAVLYKRRTQSVAVTLFSIYGVIALIIATVRTFMGGS